MPSESVPLDILLMLLLTYFHFACMHYCRPVLTDTYTAHLFPAQEVLQS